MRRIAIRRRPGWLPFAWRRLTPQGGFKSHAQKRDWQLVLDSRNIPFIIQHTGRGEHIYVSPLAEGIARHELHEFARENHAEFPADSPWALHPRAILAAFIVLPLIIIYGFQAGWWQNCLFLPNGDNWLKAGSLDGIKVIIHHQWHRAATALTLHSGLPHLAGNVAFGAIFLTLLGRITGPGRAIMLTLAAGIAGNAASVFLHGANYRSVGFSTALFGCVGIMAGLAIKKNGKKLLMPAAAALSLVAMLGTEGKNTDLAAHFCGLAAGFCLGAYENLRVIRGWPGLSQSLAGLAAYVVIVAAWLMAFGGAI